MSALAPQHRTGEKSDHAHDAVNARHIEKPSIVQEVHRPSELHEVQPVVYREIDKTEVHEQVQDIYEHGVKATQYHDRYLPSETKPTQKFTSNDVADARSAVKDANPPSFGVAPTTVAGIVKPPIVHENVKKNVIEEHTKVIHREIDEPHTFHDTKIIKEKIVKAPTAHIDHLPPVYRADTSGQRCIVSASASNGYSHRFLILTPSGSISTPSSKFFSALCHRSRTSSPLSCDCRTRENRSFS